MQTLRGGTEDHVPPEGFPSHLGKGDRLFQGFLPTAAFPTPSRCPGFMSRYPYVTSCECFMSLAWDLMCCARELCKEAGGTRFCAIAMGLALSFPSTQTPWGRIDPSSAHTMGSWALLGPCTAPHHQAWSTQQHHHPPVFGKFRIYGGTNSR